MHCYMNEGSISALRLRFPNENWCPNGTAVILEYCRSVCPGNFALTVLCGFCAPFCMRWVWQICCKDNLSTWGGYLLCCRMIPRYHNISLWGQEFQLFHTAKLMLKDEEKLSIFLITLYGSPIIQASIKPCKHLAASGCRLCLLFHPWEDLSKPSTLRKGQRRRVFTT